MSEEAQIEQRAAELFCDNLGFTADGRPTLDHIKHRAKVNPDAAPVWSACLDTAARELYPAEKRGEA